MGITVEQFYNEFGEVDRSVIAQLVGKTDFKLDDVIPLNNFASCNDKNYKNFAARKAGYSFLKLLKGKDKFETAKKVHANPANLISEHNSERNMLSLSGNNNNGIHFRV